MRRPHLSALQWAVAPFGLFFLAAPSRSATTVVSDNFNRADASTLGSNWTLIFGTEQGIVGNKAANVTGTTNPIDVLSNLTADYTHTSLRVDVSNAGGVGSQSVALCLGMNPADSASGLYMQFRTTDVTGQFNVIEMDTGQNMSDTTKWTTPTNQFIPATPFATAWITASALDADTIQVGIDKDKNGIPEETFTRNLNLANIAVGSRMGISINGTTARADDFVATVINPANVTWNVNGGGTWDFTSSNWTGGSLISTRFFNTDNAIFSNTFGGTITLAGGANASAIAPGSTTVSAASGTYTFAGSPIVGSGALNKSGAGRLVLTNANSFTGDTTVSNAGSIAANGSDAHLTLNNPSGNALSGDLHIGVASAAASTVAKVSLAQSNQIADNRVIYFDSPSGRFAYLSLRGHAETIAGIVSTSTGGAIENGNLNDATSTNGTLTLAPLAATTYAYGGIIRDADSGGGAGKLNLAVNGPGTQLLTAGTYTYTGNTTVNAGKLALQTNLTASSSISTSGGTLELSTGGGSNRVIKTQTVTVTGSGKIDLKDNKLIVTTAGATGSWTGSNYTGITGLIKSGKGSSNTWNGTTGIVTSMSAASGTNFTTLAVARASDIRPATATATGTWAGQTITGTDTLVMYTYGGDATLDGKLNIDDYLRIDQGISANLTGYSNGDFNYDGKVSIDDYITIIDANIDNQSGVFPTSSGGLASASPLVAVPEPLGLSLLIAPTLTLLWRRHRRAPIA